MLGLLIFFLPVGPSMSNSNVMAFEDYGYEETDQYERYAKNMANENYYKSQSSDIIKKIKCNNINSNLNGIDANSDTGDSLGLGAESFEADDASTSWLGNGERNNGNFDLDCTNNNKNEGPEGPHGEQGPPGITFLNATNIYLNQTRSEDLGPNEFANLGAHCDPGDVVVSGGYFAQLNTQPGGFGERDVAINQPILEPFGGGWNTNIGLVDASPGSFLRVTVSAFCFDNPPLRTPLASASVSAFQQPADTVIMSQAIGDSPITTQAIENSPKLTTLEKQPEESGDLTATEKTTKLKQQWLELLP